MQIIHKKQTNTKIKTFLTSQYSTLKRTVEQYNSRKGKKGLASSEQARRLTDSGSERRWEMAELKGGQRQETEGELQGRSALAWMAQVLIPRRNQMHVRIFKVRNLTAYV